MIKLWLLALHEGAHTFAIFVCVSSTYGDHLVDTPLQEVICFFLEHAFLLLMTVLALLVLLQPLVVIYQV